MLFVEVILLSHIIIENKSIKLFEGLFKPIFKNSRLKKMHFENSEPNESILINL